jgi:hypothetical protein
VVGVSCGGGVLYVESRISCKDGGMLSKPRVWVNTTNQNSHTISPSSFYCRLFYLFQDFFYFKLFYCFLAVLFFLGMNVAKYAKTKTKKHVGIIRTINSKQRNKRMREYFVYTRTNRSILKSTLDGVRYIPTLCLGDPYVSQL